MNQNKSAAGPAIIEYFQDAYPNPAVPEQRAVPTQLAILRKYWEAFLRDSRFADPLALHLHVPYCPRKCHFCDCSSDALDRRGSLASYVKAVEHEMDYLAPTFDGHEFSRLYVGGGTPNLLSANQLAEVLAAVDSRFRIRPGAVRCIEFAPEMAQRRHLDVAVAAGINRLSLGIQSLNADVLEGVGRRRSGVAGISRVYAMAREAGPLEINLDLIFGLPGEAEDSFHVGVETLLEWKPDTITVQLVHDSMLTRVYRSSEHQQQVEAAYVRYVKSRLMNIGATFPEYTCHIRPGTCILVHRDMARPWDQWLDFFSFRDRVVLSTLGIGGHAHSKMHGVLGYQLQSSDFDPKAELYVYQPFSEELEAVIDAACDLVVAGQFDLEPILARYALPLTRLVARAEELVEQGALQREGSLFCSAPGPVNPLLGLVRELAQECREREAGAPSSGSA